MLGQNSARKWPRPGWEIVPGESLICKVLPKNWQAQERSDPIKEKVGNGRASLWKGGLIGTPYTFRAKFSLGSLNPNHYSYQDELLARCCLVGKCKHKGWSQINAG